MKTAIYHQPPHLQDRELFIGKENPDGTLDLHDKDGVPIVTSCPVGTDGKPGTCSIVIEEKAEKAKK